MVEKGYRGGYGKRETFRAKEKGGSDFGRGSSTRIVQKAAAERSSGKRRLRGRATLITAKHRSRGGRVVRK